MAQYYESRNTFRVLVDIKTFKKQSIPNLNQSNQNLE